MRLPEELKTLLQGQAFAADGIGKSNSQVLLFEDMVLKAESGENALRERTMLQYLQGKLPVPQLLWSGEEDGVQFLLMSRLPGTMACDPVHMMQPNMLIRLLAEAIHTLWSVNTSDCPLKRDAKTRLEMIRQEIDTVSMDDAEPETYGKGGFASPKELFAWLERNVPEENFVLSHGDLCLPNVFFAEGKLSGFLDLGNSGLADPYQDLALVCRSLRHNATGKYAPKGAQYPQIDPDDLFVELGIPKDAEKMRYYLLLDELF